MNASNEKRYVVDIFKFLLFTVFSFLLMQLIKNPIEFYLLNSSLLNKIPFGLLYVFAISLPNFLFFLFLGIIFPFIMKDNLYAWAIGFCIIVYTMIFAFFRPYVSQPDFYSYMIIYFPKLIIPFAMFIGICFTKKLKTQGAEGRGHAK